MQLCSIAQCWLGISHVPDFLIHAVQPKAVVGKLRLRGHMRPVKVFNPARQT